ncbi:hypothetical protein AB205_0036140 [Aquarana catesbeiana]|uniref:Uncharacterized protein n=1 Tax=Aquarana catesbeiana TaxID=8400 RepID=A0A2G9S4Q2_AQUCT|nr:hypothetical protein AB205_0036140 [Aquarana catesbeiana]
MYRGMLMGTPVVKGTLIGTSDVKGGFDEDTLWHSEAAYDWHSGAEIDEHSEAGNDGHSGAEIVGHSEAAFDRHSFT